MFPIIRPSLRPSSNLAIKHWEHTVIEHDGTWNHYSQSEFNIYGKEAVLISFSETIHLTYFPIIFFLSNDSFIMFSIL